jgi:hypothetical protein
MQNAGFDVSFRDCPAKGGTGGHPIPTVQTTSSILALGNCVLPNLVSTRNEQIGVIDRSETLRLGVVTAVKT